MPSPPSSLYSFKRLLQPQLATEGGRNCPPELPLWAAEPSLPPPSSSFLGGWKSPHWDFGLFLSYGQSSRCPGVSAGAGCVTHTPGHGFWLLLSPWGFSCPPPPPQSLGQTPLCFNPQVQLCREMPINPLFSIWSPHACPYPSIEDLSPPLPPQAQGTGGHCGFAAALSPA